MVLQRSVPIIVIGWTKEFQIVIEKIITTLAVQGIMRGKITPPGENLDATIYQP